MLTKENLNTKDVKFDEDTDIALAEKAYREYQKDPKTYSHDEAWKEILD